MLFRYKVTIVYTLLPIYSSNLEHVQVQTHKHTHLRVHLTREDHSQLLHANVTHSRVSHEWDVASGRNRSAQLQSQTV